MLNIVTSFLRLMLTFDEIEPIIGSKNANAELKVKINKLKHMKILTSPSVSMTLQLTVQIHQNHLAELI